MDLLLLFAGSPGRVIAKDEIVATVWEGRAIGDDTLAAAVSRLRTALGETKEHRFIETLPKRGYRLVIGPDSALPTAAPAATEIAALLAKGRAALQVPLPQSLAQARVYFEAAVTADPKSAAAQAGLADALLAQHMAGQGAALAAAAKASAQAATALDPDFAEGWALLGAAMLVADRDFARADAALQRALSIAPDLVRAHRVRSFALTAIGRFPEAEREGRRALDGDPLSLSAHVDLVNVLLCARRFSHALVEAKRTTSLAPGAANAWSALGWSYAFGGSFDQAADALIESIRLSGADNATLETLRAANNRGGFGPMCFTGALMFEQQKVLFVARPMDLAMLYAMGDHPDEAFAALENALRADDPVLMLLPYLPHLDRLRNDPRFAAVLTRARPVR
jgi:tetratricopeptide (TPR) repeat protein